MTTEHLRLLLEDDRGKRLFVVLGEQAARAQIPDVAVELLRLGWLTALSKPDGGVRGDCVASDVFRRLVGRTIAQQLSKAAETATAPHQYALSTRAGCECVAHILQGITSVDGVRAYDSISLETMLTGLLNVEGGRTALPFVRRTSFKELWEDDSGDSPSNPARLRRGAR